jgi:hypothetical protein
MIRAPLLLEVLLRHVDRKKLKRPEIEALTVFYGQLARIRQLKRRMLGHG